MTAADLMRDVRVAPSILSADFARLGEQVEQVMDAGARVIHVDVMDGHFVPPITIGPLIVESLRDLVHDRGGVLDVHLMVERPEHRVEEFASAGADTLIVHWEATPHVHYALKAVRGAGLHAGLAINPATPPEAVAALVEAGHPELAPYALCLGYRIRYVLDMNAREAMHLIELRSGREGHPAYRAVAHALHAEIARVHPSVAAAMTFVDRDTEPRLERILSEIRTQAKQTARA